MSITKDNKPNNGYSRISIGLASPEEILAQSSGEVLKPETINYRTYKPERDGLFCERIFGPVKDYECHCGKYKRIRYKGIVCDRCGVEVTEKKVRRERMGHISLVVPVVHIWYFRSLPSKIGYLLGIPSKKLEAIIYYERYVVINAGAASEQGIERLATLSEKEYLDVVAALPKGNQSLDDSDPNKFVAMMGAEAVYTLLKQVDLDSMSYALRHKASTETSQQRKSEALKCLNVIESFRASEGKNKPEWMVLNVIPVIPPELRPLVPLDGGRFATSDLNDLYRRVIIRNNRLKRLIEIKAPEVILRNEKRMLQEAVDSLFDNSRKSNAVKNESNRPLKSLSDSLKGKQGRFRQNLLGKRVDYSGRSVIVVGPELKMYQCGVPKEMAIELFRPFVMKKLVEDGVANNIKSAKKMVDRQKPEVWDALDVVIKEHPVLLNRAPTLHRLGIQAFEPVLVEGRALKLHPLACTAYNADFDGDQMAIHVPLSAEAQAEARILMLSVNNLLRPQDGHPHSIPTQDMVLGSYYLTYVREEEGTGMAFSTPEEALMAYQAGAVTLHSPIKVRVTKTIDGVEKYKTVETTVGRIIFNEPIPQDLGFVDRTDPEHAFDYEVGFRVDKKKLGEIIDRCIQKHGFTISAEVLDSIKAQGYKFSTRSGMTISIADMVVPEAKKEKIAETEKKVLAIEKQYRRGLITNDERYRMVVAEWERTTGEVAKALMDNLDEFNPINIMATSGARGSANQIRQLAGMRGLMANTAGKTIEIPIKANFREGLSVLEYFISTRGARKGMADTALRTADSGYLTRRMVDVSQDVIIREPDCGTTEGVPATAIDSRGYAVFTLDPEDPKYDEYIHSFGENIHGRFPAKPVVDPKTGGVLFDTDHLLMSGDAKFLAAHGVASVEVRSVLSCESRCGVCARCYGMNLATGKPVNSGEAVGVIAAQSIGEPGTQLTMRTFHSGGVAGDDITQGLPRVEELFEARKPKKMAVLSEISGTLTIEEARKNMMALTVTNAEQGETRVYQVPVGAGIIVQNGDHIEQGQELTRGALSPHDVLRIRGVNDDEFGRPGVRNYLVQEVQKVYRQQGVDINNKHIEVIVRQMMRKVRIEDAGSTDLLSGSTVDVNELKDANKAIQARIDAGEEGLTLAAGTPILLGITKASLATDSWMSAASFQETTKVLTEAAIKGKVDHLVGLKENVIIGKLIPAGSGLDMYRNFEMKTDESIEDEADYVDLSELKKLTNAL